MERTDLPTTTFDPAVKKAVLRLFTYGLYAVTCTHDGDANVFTANWLTQVSFDPAMLAVSVERCSVSLPLILASGLFAVHVYAADQRELAGALGRSRARVGDKLATVVHSSSPYGLPLLTNTLGYVECRVEGRLDAGDSVLITGEVIGAGMHLPGDPLTMHDAGFRHSG